MNFAYSEAQETLRNDARVLLATECPLSLVHAAENQPDAVSHELWRKVAASGWLGLGLPVAYAGGGAGFLDLVVLIEELGYALAPVPFVETVVCCGLTLADIGTDEQKSRFLPGISRGDRIMALALTEADGAFDPDLANLKAEPFRDGYQLNGTKLFVAGAAAADYLLCLARTQGKPGEKLGLSFFIVKVDSSDVRVTPLDTIAGDRQCAVDFKDTYVAPENLLVTSNSEFPTIRKTIQRGAVAECARMTGIAQRMLEMAVDFSKERIVFGQPVGSFQVIQHRCADMLVNVEASRLVTCEAAWRISEGLEAAQEVAVAKAWTSQACQQVCADASHIHGAIGFTAKHDAQLFMRRAKAAELAFGYSRHHTVSIAMML